MQLNGLVEARSIERGLRLPGNGESILEANNGAQVDPEEAARLLAKCAVPQVAGEPVGQAEIALEQGEAQRGRQVHDDDVGFCQIQDGNVIVFGD